MTYTTDGRLGKLIARGGKLSANVAERVTGGSVELTTEEASQLTLYIVDDADLNVLGSRLFDAGTPTKAGSRLDFAGLRFEVRAVEIAPRGDDHTLTVTARPVGLGRMKRARGPLVRRNLSPTAFVRALARDAGLEFVGQPSASRKTIARKAGEAGDTPESSWDVATRLAGELGYIVFEAAGVLYFGQPTWLVDELDEFRLTWKGDRTADVLDALPTCRRSGDDEDRLATIDASLRGDEAEALTPGMALNLAGVPTFEDRYLIRRITIPFDEATPVALSAETPVNPDKVDRITATGGSSSSVGGVATGSKSAATFVSIALAQAGDTYIYGAEADASNADPTAFDCSELVQWAAARAGVPFVDGSTAQIAACKPISVEEGIATRGALLFTSSPSNHIVISLGNGNTIEAANSRVGVVSYPAAGRFQRAGLIPGMRY